MTPTQVLRAALFQAIVFVTVVPVAIGCVLWSPLPLHWRYRLTTLWPRLVIAAARIVLRIEWRVIGESNLPDAPVILLSKHQSTWETLFYPTYLPRELCYVFKRELLWLPFFGWGIGLLDMIHIDRRRGGEAFEQVVAQGTRKLAEGRSIILFPEGTRTRVGTRGRYKTGGARLAVRTGVPVVPIAVNSGECWPRHWFVRYPGLITVSIGPAIGPDGKTPEQLCSELEDWIESEMRRISPHVYAGQPQRTGCAPVGGCR